MKEELIKYLKAADAEDLKACLVENLEKDSYDYFAMLSEIYWNDQAHFRVLSDGCKAAMIIYLHSSNWSARFH